MTRTFTAVFHRAEEGGYVAWVEELPGANTQGETLEETRENLRDVIQLVLETRRELAMEGFDEADVFREEVVVET
jgi:predicted RNase H-like HicB family nuclease